MAHVTRRQPLRPMPFDGPGDERNDTWPDSLDESRPLVYLTFGTTPNHPAALRAALEAIAPLHVQVLVTVGPAGDPSALGDQPSHVQVERYVPQSRVFSRCRLVVSHGGSGTFLGAATAAVPQLCLPQAADQFLNAEACVRSGVGLSLSPNRAVGSVAEAVQRLLTDPSFQAHADAVAAELAQMPSPSEILGVIETLGA